MYVAHITGFDGVARRFALMSFDLADARNEARLLGRSVFRHGFVYSVRQQ